MQRGTSTELTLEKIKGFEKDHWTIGIQEEYTDRKRMMATVNTFNRILEGYRTWPEDFAIMATLQAMVDAGYRAGKRAERARRKVQTAA
ncbi:hypothetical protein [Faecalibaculum rodentium]|uniref:hypothetical protein n=1 Tax=Faecalibaculum rodentium TaxID=1702221 RepID=UPI001F587D47|nr:hypothetical protein [Faecalibaculum rodentium]